MENKLPWRQMANIFNAFQRDHRWLRPLLRQLRHHLCLHLGRLVTLALGLSRVRTVAWRHHVRHPLLARDADLARAQRKDCPSREGREIFSLVAPMRQICYHKPTPAHFEASFFGKLE